METAEAAQGGPRYAPDDPSLPKPWKGLIDGSSGVLYYWNPETNITQYEKPSALTPQQGQQMSQQQVYRQQGSQIPQTEQQHGSQSGQATQQLQMQHQISQHFAQYPGQYMPQQQGQHMGQPGLQHHRSQLAQPGHQYASQHMQYQQTILQQGQQHNSHQSPLNNSQAPLINKQEYGGYCKREETEYQHVNQYGLSPSLNQQTGEPYAQNLPGGINSTQKVSQPGQGQQFSGSSVMPHPAAAAQIPQTGTDFSHPQHGSRFQNQMGPPMVHAQHASGPSAGLKMEYEGPGNDFRFNPHVDAPNMEMRMDGSPHQNVHGGGSNSVAAEGMHMHSQASSSPAFPNSPSMKPPFSDASNLSTADAYRKQLEVTVSGDNVPAPFMTFKATGFPPQILREVRYLLRRRAYVVRCYSVSNY